MEKQRILVELDCLLDTRLGVVSQLNEDAAVKLLELDYWSRKSDDFEKMTGGMITNNDFKEAYKKRDIETLKRSRSTALPYALATMTTGLDAMAANTPLIERPTLTINTHPYKLDDDEREAIAAAVTTFVGVDVKLDFASIPLELLSPSVLKNSWEAVILYEFDRWLNTHYNTLLSCKIPRNVLMVPALSAKGDPEVDDYTDPEFGVLPPFAAAEFLLTEFISLDMIDPLYMSIIRA